MPVTVIPPGKPLRLFVNFKDVAGAPADPTDPLLEVLGPTGSRVQYSGADLVNPVVGRWETVVAPEEDGTWRWRWTCSAPFRDVSEGVFEVTSSPFFVDVAPPTDGEVSAVPNTMDLDLYAGDGTVLRLKMADASGNPIGATGSVAAQVRKTRGDPAPQADFAVDLTDAATGVVLLSLTGEQTAALVGDGTLFTGVWDCQWTPAGQEPLTIVQGAVRCVLDVTRA